MSRGWTKAAFTIGFVLAMWIVGCDAGLSVPIDVRVPPEVQYVFDHVADFRSPADDPLESVEPGTVMDDLAGLSGCWAKMFTEAQVQSGLAFFAVYHFDAAAGTFTRWSLVGLESGGLWPVLPVISAETGVFEVASATTIRMTVQRNFANMDVDTGEVLSELREIPVEREEPLVRTALVTLDGERMLLYIDTETPEEVDADEERPIFYRFDCPTPE